MTTNLTTLMMSMITTGAATATVMDPAADTVIAPAPAMAAATIAMHTIENSPTENLAYFSLRSACEIEIKFICAFLGKTFKQNFQVFV